MAQPKTRNRIIDAMLALAAERPWQQVTLESIAERAGLALASLRGAYDGRIAVLEDFVRRTDEQALAGLDAEMGGEPMRERLFDVLFSRLELLKPHKAAIRSIARAACRDPILALELNRIEMTAMVWMLASSGIDASGGRGAIRAQGLVLVWAKVMRVWLNDEDPGLAKTMAELDKGLRRGERAVMRMDRLCRFLCGSRRGTQDKAAPDTGEVAEAHPS